MHVKKITLTLPTLIIDKLLEDKDKFAYSSIQEIIAETLRNKYFRSILTGEKKPGRPRKIREERILARKKIFAKDGVAIDV